MIDVEICLEAIEKKGVPKWKVEVRSLEPLARALVEPLCDNDLATVPDLAPEARTWKGFLRSLSPNDAYRPPSITLRAVGRLIMRRILGDRVVAQHLDRIEARAQERCEKLRILLEVFEGEDPILTRLPVELAHDGDRFFFKRWGVPSIRCDLSTEARNIYFNNGARVLIATAHADKEPQPDQASLLAHAEAVATAVRGAGFAPEHLADATTSALREKLLMSPQVDILYLVCHGIEDPDQMGQLVLRDKALPGEELGRWLEEATELGRAVQVVILCACSSAVPQIDEGTSGMAQWLVRPRRALATIGFRGAVLVPWALRFSERIFEHFGRGAQLEEAFAAARNAEPDAEPQWVLPLCYGRRSEPVADSSVERSVVVLRDDVALRDDAHDAFEPFDEDTLELLRTPPLPRTPRPYFTGRTVELAQLRTWARTPGAAQITAVAGEGGIGKTELAAKLAHEMRDQGRFVVWLERADQDPRGALGALIAIKRRDFQAKPDATEADVAAVMRRDLGPLRGLLVLDDISDRSVVDRLNPGAGWNVLVTTRVHDLLPGILGIDLRPMASPEALRLLAQVAWDAERPPAEERASAELLVERLGRLPLAIELAGATLRDLVTAEEYLADLERDGGVAASDRARVHATLTRSLGDLGAQDERVFLALGILPVAGAMGQMVATTVGEALPVVSRRLDRLVRHHLAAWSPDVGRYGLHPLLHDAARERAKARAELWQELHLGAARAIDELAEWVYAPVGKQTDLARTRWLEVRDIFDALQPEPWLEGAPGGEHVAIALSYADFLRTDRSIDEREALLTTAEILSRTGDSRRRAHVLKARGHMRHFRADLDGAAADFDDALALYKAIENHLGQANVLKARGHIRRFRADLDGAAADFDDALALYKAVENHLGQANVLRARGDLRRRRADLDGAASDYDDALALSKTVEDRLGQANVLKARGDLRLFRADLEGAAKDYDHALTLFEAFEERLGHANVLLARGHLRIRRADLDGAANDYDDALALYKAIEFSLGQANVLKARGDLEFGRGRLLDARRWYGDAAPIYGEVQDALGLAIVLAKLAQIHAVTGDKAAAEQAATEALRLALSSENRYAAQLAQGVLDWVRQQADKT